MINAKSIICIFKGGWRVLVATFFIYILIVAFPFQYHLLHRSGELAFIDQLSFNYQGHDYSNIFLGYLTVMIWGAAFGAGWRLYLTALAFYEKITARKDQGGGHGK